MLERTRAPRCVPPRTRQVGGWVAPEVVDGRKYDDSVDLFSVRADTQPTPHTTLFSWP